MISNFAYLSEQIGINEVLQAYGTGLKCNGIGGH